MLPIMPL